MGARRSTDRASDRAGSTAAGAATAIALGAALLVMSCSAAYYATMEQLGIEKRDILVDRVEETRDAQEDAKEQFASALDRFRALISFDGGDLEETYDRLAAEHADSQSRAEAVRTRVAEVEDVASDLFAEWRDELDEYSSADLRRKSEATLRETERRYQRLIDLLQRSLASMDPVLTTMNDQVLYLKHNLNAKAIGSLGGTARELERDVDRLIADMESAIAEADAFIKAMGQESAG